MIRLRGVSVSFEEFHLLDINLDIDPGCFFMLMGPTGAGKTVLLEAIAGHHRLRAGSVNLRGVDVTHAPPERRSIGIVYQDYALFPHLSVEENIRFADPYLRTLAGNDATRRSVSAEERGARFERLVGQLGIAHLLHRKPDTLSGGEAQRTALARALYPDPDVVLLDEPLSALDPAFRGELRSMLRDIHRDSGKTFLAVTHDFADAVELGTRGAIMNRGRIIQHGPVDELFSRPANDFVARFVSGNR